MENHSHVSAVRVKPRLRGVSHQIACFVALFAGVMLVRDAATPRAAIAAAIYGASMVCLFGVSALYHRPTWNVSQRRFMRKLDHASIFILIAGSYTPVCMLALEPQSGTRMLWIVWLGAAAGILQAIFWIHSPKPITAGIYLLLGWVLLPYVSQVYTALGSGGASLILLGGAFYSVGAVFYALRRPDPFPTVFGYHEIFHALVVAAAVCHFVALYPLVH